MVRSASDRVGATGVRRIPAGWEEVETAVSAVRDGELAKERKGLRQRYLGLFGWQAMTRCAGGPAHTTDLLDRRSLVYDSRTLTIFLGQRYLWALPLFQQTPGPAFVQCRVTHSRAVGDEPFAFALLPDVHPGLCPMSGDAG